MTDEPKKSQKFIFALIPLAVFIPLAIIFYKGLDGKPSELPSALIGKPAPEFNLPAIPGSNIPGLATADLKKGTVSVVNVWSSWCGPCRQEHPYLELLKARKDINFVSFNTKDTADNALLYLRSLGQPYAAIGFDQSGRTAIDWGTYGAPETFIVDGQGIVRYKWIGALSPEIIQGSFAKEIEKAKSPQS